MNSYSILLRNKLLRKIEEFGRNKKQFVARPGYDFIRSRKMDFKTTIMVMLTMGGGSLPKVIENFFETEPNIVTTSAFIQQRDKINVRCFQELFKDMSNISRGVKKHKGLRLLAIDGSKLNTPYNPNCQISFETQKIGRGFNSLHLDALYDVKNHIYLDASISPLTEMNETGALVDMVSRSTLKKDVILMADRGYESYNLFATVAEKGWNYLVRVKDIGSTGILRSLNVPKETEFDIDIATILTNKQTNYIKKNNAIFTLIPSTSRFDYLDNKIRFYKMDYRLIRFRLPNGSYEAIITNLSRRKFSVDDISNLYKERWAIETSFRHLKYALGIVNLHSKKVDNIYKEIYAKLVMYNFTELIISKSILSSTKDAKNSLYEYKPDLSIVSEQCIKLFRLCRLKNPPNIEATIHRNTHPIRPGRVFKRNVKAQSHVSFNLRVT